VVQNTKLEPKADDAQQLQLTKNQLEDATKNWKHYEKQYQEMKLQMEQYHKELKTLQKKHDDENIKTKKQIEDLVNENKALKKPQEPAAGSSSISDAKPSSPSRKGTLVTNKSEGEELKLKNVGNVQAARS